MIRVVFVLALLLLLPMPGCGSTPGPGRPIAPVPRPIVAADAPPPPPAAVPELRSTGHLGARHRAIVEKARAGAREIAFLGDSITQGWEHEGKAEWDKTWAPHHALNCGIGGDRTQHVLGRLDDGLLDALAAENNHIRWVVLLIGTNNTSHPADTAEDIFTGVRAIVDRLRSRLPKARIALMAVFPRGRYPNPQRDSINALNVRLARLANADPVRVRFLDIGPKFLDATGELPAAMMPDYLHPSPSGYATWSEALQRLME